MRPLDRAGTLTRGVLDEDGEAGAAASTSTGTGRGTSAMLRPSSFITASSVSTPSDDVRVPPKQCVMATPSPPKARGPLAWLVGGGRASADGSSASCTSSAAPSSVDGDEGSREGDHEVGRNSRPPLGLASRVAEAKLGEFCVRRALYLSEMASLAYMAGDEWASSKDRGPVLRPGASPADDFSLPLLRRVGLTPGLPNEWGVEPAPTSVDYDFSRTRRDILRTFGSALAGGGGCALACAPRRKWVQGSIRSGLLVEGVKNTSAQILVQRAERSVTLAFRGTTQLGEEGLRKDLQKDLRFRMCHPNAWDSDRYSMRRHVKSPRMGEDAPAAGGASPAAAESAPEAETPHARRDESRGDQPPAPSHPSSAPSSPSLRASSSRTRPSPSRHATPRLKNLGGRLSEALARLRDAPPFVPPNDPEQRRRWDQEIGAQISNAYHALHALHGMPLGVRVHKGFFSAYKRIMFAIVSAVSELFASGDFDTLLVTGHSLGGALAMLAALDIVRSCAPVLDRSQVAVYTFGSPKVGNRRFRDWFDRNVPNCFRVVNAGDRVAQMPPELFGYKHAGTLVIASDRGCWVSPSPEVRDREAKDPAGLFMEGKSGGSGFVAGVVVNHSLVTYSTRLRAFGTLVSEIDDAEYDALVKSWRIYVRSRGRVRKLLTVGPRAQVALPVLVASPNATGAKEYLVDALRGATRDALAVLETTCAALSGGSPVTFFTWVNALKALVLDRDERRRQVAIYTGHLRKALFDVFDRDGDGRVASDELRRIFAELHDVAPSRLSDAYLDAVRSEMRLPSKAPVTFDELSTWILLKALEAPGTFDPTADAAALAQAPGLTPSPATALAEYPGPGCPSRPLTSSLLDNTPPADPPRAHLARDCAADSPSVTEMEASCGPSSQSPTSSLTPSHPAYILRSLRIALFGLTS